MVTFQKTNRHIISVLVENKAGVLSRVTGLISRRGFNIASLAVGPTEDPDVSRMTIVVDADDEAFEQITKQLNKLVSVLKITRQSSGVDIVRELMLVKVAVSPEDRSQVIEVADIFRAKIIDVGVDSVTIEATGDENKLEGLESLLRPYGIREIIRTGKIAMPRSSRD